MTTNISPASQLMIELINRARSDPGAEASRLGIDLNEGLAANTISDTEKQALAPNQDLVDAIAGHLDYLFANDVGLTHTGQGNSRFDERIKDEGYDWNAAGENLAVSYQSANQTDLQKRVVDLYELLFIDEGISGRGHRRNFLNNSFEEIGTGTKTGNYAHINFSPNFTVFVGQDFGRRTGNNFLTGVAFKDDVVKDNFYTIGEALGGVTITATRVTDNAVFSATTGAAGGYSLQLAAGTYNVTASGGGLAKSITTNNVAVGSQNVKLDFVAGVAPAKPTYTGPTGTITDRTPTLTWTSVANAAEYDLWVNNETTGEKEVIREKSLTTNSFTPSSDLAYGTYRVWVRGVSSDGQTGAWSDSQTFTLEAPPPDTATLIGPGGTINDATPTFEWNAATNASSYQLLIFNNDTNETVLKQWFSETSHTPTELLAEGNYTFWVRTWGNGKYGQWSEGKSFTVEIPTPATATLIGPGGTINDATPKLEWNEAENATSYQLYVYNNDTKELEINQWVKDTSFTPTTLLKEGNHTFWIRTWGNGKYGQWSEGKTFNLEILTPETATLVGPGGTTGTTPKFEWNAAANATSYYLLVYNNDTNETVIGEWMKTTSHTPGTALAEGNYTFWIRTWGNGKYGEWSNGKNFAVSAATAPDAPSLIPPSTNPTSDHTPLIRWNAVDDAVKYELRVDNQSTGELDVVRRDDITKTSHETPFLASGTYRVRVRAINNQDVVSEWSDFLDITIS